jgi:CRP-like cAMP-binding protein
MPSWVRWIYANFPTPPGRFAVQFDPSAFLADPDLLTALEKCAKPIACDEDRVLFRQGDPPIGVYILSRGEATLTMDSNNGRSLFSCRAVAGSLLGLPALIGNQPYSLSGIASRGAQVGFIDSDAFNTLMQTEAWLMVKVLQVLAAEVRSARMAITKL